MYNITIKIDPTPDGRKFWCAVTRNFHKGLANQYPGNIRRDRFANHDFEQGAELSVIPTLTPSLFHSSMISLANRDLDLGNILAMHGPPPLWDRVPGFPSLIWIILEQQVSIASAQKAFERLLDTASPLTPERFLELDNLTLKAVGFSRQKTTYCRGLAQSILTGQLNLEGLEEMDDVAVRSTLTSLKGIGPWTAEIYLLMVLLRPDAWPAGDLALMKAVQWIKHLPELPSADELEAISLPWKPWRAVAARMLWHYFLETRRRK